MSNVMSPNGRARKTLADQIDRLDRVLDGLAEGLNEAVAAEVQRAVGRAVREAVQAAIKEVLTNPELSARLRGSTAMTTPAAPATATAVRLWRRGRGRRLAERTRAGVPHRVGSVPVSGQRFIIAREAPAAYRSAASRLAEL